MIAGKHKTHSSTTMQLSLMGGFALHGKDGKQIKITNRKACALLAYLALKRNRTETRERLAGLFWSERSEDQARASLRQSLKQLRILFGNNGLEGFATGRLEISLAESDLEVDLISHHLTLERGEVPDALIDVQIAPDRILYGFENIDHSFSAWLQVIRQQHHDRFVNQLQNLLRLNGHVAGKAAEALVIVDPTHEEAHRFLIRDYANAGNTAAALRQYKMIWDILGNDYDMEPDEDTQNLIASFKSGEYQRVEEVPVSSLRDSSEKYPLSPAHISSYDEQGTVELPVISIDRFVVGGPWKRESYFIDGFRRELVAALVRFREWVAVEGEVSPRPGNEISFPGTNSPSPRYKLEGTYLEECDIIRLIITLKEMTTMAYVWSEQVELTLDNWSSAQQTIVRRIAIALNVNLSARRLAQAAGYHHMELPAYDLWLRGQSIAFGFRAENWKNASSMFQKIISTNTRFAPAFSSLAQLENSVHLAFPGTYRTKKSHEYALELARRAVEIDPLDTRSHLCLGWAYALNGSFELAELSFDLACELNQNDPWTLVSSALGFAFSDNTDRALNLADQALTLNPNPSNVHWGYQATLRYICGDYEGCISAVNSSENSISNLSGWKASALVQLGHGDEAKKTATRFVDNIASQWSAKRSPHQQDIGNWFLHCFPIRNSVVWRRLRNGLAEAGVQVSDRDGPIPPL